MKKMFLLFLILGSASCSIDDDAPVLPEIVVNEFCYGVDSAESAGVSAAFNENIESVTNGIYTTKVFITDEGFTVLDNDRLDGNGFLIALTLVGDQNILFQTGNYSINSGTEVANAQVTYFEDFDTSAMINQGTVVESGIVIVRPYSTGYYIQIDGVDREGNDFHGIYLGNSKTIL